MRTPTEQAQPRPIANGIYTTSLYQSRPPTPPDILIPYRALPQEGQPSEYLTFNPALSLSFLDDSNQRSQKDLTSILTSIPSQSLHSTSHYEWTYNLRREPQLILPNLYLGPPSAARNEPFLRREAITACVILRTHQMAQIGFLGTSKIATSLGIETVHFQADDYVELIRSFPSIIQSINLHLVQVHRQQQQKTGKVLVICDTGNKQSASVVAAYIMAMFGADMITAVQFVQSRRFCADFDVEQKQMLKSWEEILAARRAVAGVEAAVPVDSRHDGAVLQEESKSKQGGTKRTLDDTWDEDMDLDDSDVLRHDDIKTDLDRFVGRENYKPFVDDSV